MLSLSRIEFADKLKTGNFTDVQSFCKAVQVSAKGARTELENRLLEYKDKHDSRITSSRVRSAFPEGGTPEGRPGRARSPHVANSPRAWPLPDALPAVQIQSGLVADETMNANDPMQKHDPWQHFSLSTPQTRRSNDAHSGFTPMLSEKFQKMDEFLNLPGSEPSVPNPASDENPVLAAILAGVQNLQRNSVTRDQLKQFVDLQRQEFQTHVLAEKEPLHNAVTKIHSNMESLARDTHNVAERMSKIEGRVTQFQSAGIGEPLRDANDPAYSKIAFLNFPAESSVFHRLKAMKEFMAAHFPKVTPVCTNLFSDNKGEPSVHGFVQVVDSKCAKRIVEECGAQHWKLDGFPDVKIKRAKAAVDMNRDWALRRAEELVKSHPAALGKTVNMERGSNTHERGIYVDGVRVFEQGSRFSKDGIFLHGFASLCLR